MKILLIEVVGHLGDESAIGLIHLEGPFDSTACGLSYDEYDLKASKKRINCPTCNTVLSWAKKVSKHIKTAPANRDK